MPTSTLTLLTPGLYTYEIGVSECFPLSKIMLSQLKYTQVLVKWELSPNYSKSICITSQWYSVVFYHHQIFRFECTAFTKPGDRERQSVWDMWWSSRRWRGFHCCSDSESPGLCAVIWTNPTGFGCMWEITVWTLLVSLYYAPKCADT